ncbi:MAG: DUF1934 domain-containing protein [Candidatus Izemoplasmatales bacterium]|nr:DUF1934 domain-containing protein [bacterium]MDZ4196536.1 DUF1934 domain-containing protein [Candidatus Izemoplasmatales bacterium]
MNPLKITFISAINGENMTFQTENVQMESNRLTFQLDSGERYLLRVDNNQITMIREGDMKMKLVFIKNQHSMGEIQVSNQTIPLHLLTKQLSWTPTTIYLHYVLLDGDEVVSEHEITIDLSQEGRNITL